MERNSVIFDLINCAVAQDKVNKMFDKKIKKNHKMASDAVFMTWLMSVGMLLYILGNEAEIAKMKIKIKELEEEKQ